MKKRVVNQGLTGMLVAAMVFGSVIMPLNVQAEESADGVVVKEVLTEENTIIRDEALMEVEAQGFVLEEYVIADDEAEIQRLYEEQSLVVSDFCYAWDLFDRVWGNVHDWDRHVMNDLYDWMVGEHRLGSSSWREDTLIDMQITHAANMRKYGTMRDDIGTWITTAESVATLQGALSSPGSRLNKSLSSDEIKNIEVFVDEFLALPRYTEENLNTMTELTWEILALTYVPGVDTSGNGANDNTITNGDTQTNGTNNSNTINTDTQNNASAQTNDANKQANPSPQSNTPTTSGKVSAPNTGDMANVIMYASLALLASGVIATLVIRKKRLA